MLGFISLLALIILLSLVQPIVAPNATYCVLTALASPELYRDGWRNAAGRLEADPQRVVGISLGVCNKVCGGLSPLSWSIFFQQFTAWLLPWLALISQLPYGARTTRENILSMLLTIGSPTLALYSLAFTVLNGKYVVRRFSPFWFPNDYNAARIFACLQQAPLRLSRVPGHLESLIALEVNDLWFKKFREMIEYEQNWGISAISSIGWVLLAYIFTVLDSFISFPQYAKNTGDLNENGEAVGTVWLWLLPIVVGWLQLSPKYHYSKICAAFKIANDYANVGDALSDQLTAHELEPFYLAEYHHNYPRDSDGIQDTPFDKYIFGDEANTSPSSISHVSCLGSKQRRHICDC